MRRLAATAFVTSCALTAHDSLAAAPKERVQVLSLSSESAYENAQALGVALKRAVDRSPRFALGPGDYSLEVVALALGCSDPPDTACQAKIGAKIGAERYVWGSVEKQGAEVVATLHLWEKGAEAATTEVRYAANLTDASDDALLDVARRAVAELSGGATAALVVRCPTEGTVLVDGEVKGQLVGGRAEVLAPIGAHEVVVRTPAGKEVSGRVDVAEGGTSTLTLAAPKGATPPIAPPPDAPPREPETPTSRYFGYGSLGLGAVLVGGGVWAALRVSSIDGDPKLDAYRDALPKGKNACEAADAGYQPANTETSPADVRKLCHDGSSMQTLEFALFGAGALALGVGTYLLLSEPKERTPAARLTPRFAVSPRGADFDVLLEF